MSEKTENTTRSPFELEMDKARKEIKANPLLKASVFTDGGPWAEHNMPCCVHRDEHAVLNLNEGIFVPSDKARKEGWMLIKPPAWVKWLLVELGLTGTVSV